jgi:hypothetical protein
MVDDQFKGWVTDWAGGRSGNRQNLRCHSIGFAELFLAQSTLGELLKFYSDSQE